MQWQSDLEEFLYFRLHLPSLAKIFLSVREVFGSINTDSFEIGGADLDLVAVLQPA